MQLLTRQVALMSDMCLKTRYLVFFLFIGGVGVSLGDVSFLRILLQVLYLESNTVYLP